MAGIDKGWSGRVKKGYALWQYSGEAKSSGRVRVGGVG